jgi:AcrR family transcriptional regulator
MAGSTGKRTGLVGAARELVYRNGYGATTLADIAGAADVPVGNIYYYFKTKDAIASAVIASRRDEYALLRDRWERNPLPRGRLLAFVTMTLDACGELVRSGCPIGSLCSELQKGRGPVGAEAGGLLSDWLAWLERQFRALGHDRSKAAADALHLLAMLQGATVLAHALGSADVLVGEATRARDWIESL